MAFSIWRVIYALAIVQAIAVLVVGSDGIPRRLQVDQVVLYLGGTLWIVLAGLDSSLATATAPALMFVAALDGVLTAARHRIRPGWLAWLTLAAIGLYAGWVTAAFFLNVSTALVDADVVEVGDVAWHIVMVALAVAALLAVLLITRNLAYAPRPLGPPRHRRHRRPGRHHRGGDRGRGRRRRTLHRRPGHSADGR